MAKETKKAERIVPAIAISRWSEAQFKQARHSIVPDVTMTYDDVLSPAFYANLAPKILAGDIIEVRPADGSYYAELYVWAKGPNWLQVSELVVIERPASAVMPSVNKAFSIEFVEGPAKYRVVRESDRATVASGFESPDEANDWVGKNAKRVAA